MKLNDTAISCRNLQISYEADPVIHSVDMEVTPGQLVAIIGENASGKSTLLRGLARLQKLDDGDVYLRGTRCDELHDREFARRVAYLPQTPSVVPDMSVRALVERGRTPHFPTYAVNGSAVDRVEVDNALEQVGLTASADRSLKILSGGELQRAWVAFALVRSPEVLLLDEPTSHLDVRYQRELMQLLSELKEKGIAIIVAMHDISLAIAFADRVIGLDSGKIAFDCFADSENILEDLGNVLHSKLLSFRTTEGSLAVVPDWHVDKAP